ncbi:MAG TPA: DUF885 domain-containing protein, partial [Elusimicrobiota bacterium]|nr:DUF885 domain-containing protein [Elusimicrobiota bacterium]
MRLRSLALLLCAAPAWCALAAPPAVVAPAAPAAKTFAKAAVDQLAADYWDASLRLNPLTATFVRYPRYQDRLPDISAVGREDERRTFTALLERLKTVDRAALEANDRITYDLMREALELELSSLAHKFWQWNVDSMDGPQTTIPAYVELAQPMANEADAEALLARIRAMPVLFASQIENLKEGLAEGRVASRIAVTRTSEQLAEMLKTPADQTPFAAAAKRLPEPLRAKYAPLVAKAVAESTYGAYRLYLDFLSKEYLSRSRPDDKPGLSYLPGAKAAYAWKIRYFTTVDKSADELHAVGLEELDGIRKEMEAITRRMGHSGDIRSFIDKAKADKANYFKSRQEMLDTARAMIARAQSLLPRFFGVLPKTPLVVKATEEYREKNAAAAEYYPPDDQLTRPGIYYIDTYSPETHTRFGMASLAAHEGLPGHHFQMALSLENRSLPAFRRNGGSDAYVEGWALYSERLADEMGLYTDDLSRLGMLSDQALRACRLVVDTGLHAKGWSRRRAIDFMRDNTLLSEEESTAEIDRYIVWPGQALAYKVGQREIQALRRESATSLGDKFDIRAFHDLVLKNGPVTLPILRKVLLGRLCARSRSSSRRSSRPTRPAQP